MQFTNIVQNVFFLSVPPEDKFSNSLILHYGEQGTQRTQFYDVDGTIENDSMDKGPFDGLLHRLTAKLEMDRQNVNLCRELSQNRLTSNQSELKKWIVSISCDFDIYCRHTRLIGFYNDRGKFAVDVSAYDL